MAAGGKSLNMDEELCKIYNEVMEKILKNFEDLENTKISRLVLPLPKAKCKGKQVPQMKGHCIAQQLLPQKLAFLLECCICTSSLIIQHFDSLLKLGIDSIPKILQRQNVNICCLPGTLGAEAVAVVLLFTRQWNPSRDDHAVHTKFHVTFVDVNEDWRKFVETTLQTLKELNETWHIPKVTFSFEKEAPSRRAESADIVFVVKNFLDISNIAKKTFDKMLKIAFQNMKHDSILFCLDSSFGEYTKELSFLLQNMPGFHRLHKNSLEMNSIRDHLNLYKDHFGQYLNAICNLISATSWVKEPQSAARLPVNEKNLRHKAKILHEPNEKKKKKSNKTKLFLYGSLNVEEVGEYHVKLKWKKVDSTKGQELEDYVIEKTDEHTGHWVQCGQIGPEEDTFTVEGLKPQKKYLFSIKITSKDGESASLITKKEIKTKGLCDKSSSKNISQNVRDVSTDCVKAKCKSPDDDSRQKLKSSLVGKTKIVSEESSDHFGLKKRALTSNASMQAQGDASNNKELPAAIVELTGVRNYWDKPSPPIAPVVVDWNRSEVELKWQVPAYNHGSPILYYIIESKEITNHQWCQVVKTKNNYCGSTIQCLSRFAVLTFRVRAVNEMGTGEPSISTMPIVVDDKYEKPGKPGEPNIIKCDNAKVELDWTAPEYDGGSPILHYIIERMDMSNGDWTGVIQIEGDHCRGVVECPKQNLVVKFRVKAVNKFEVGEPSEPTMYITVKYQE